MVVGLGNCKGSLKRFLAFQAAVVRYEAVFARTIIFLARETKGADGGGCGFQAALDAAARVYACFIPQAV